MTVADDLGAIDAWARDVVDAFAHDVIDGDAERVRDVRETSSLARSSSLSLAHRRALHEHVRRYHARGMRGKSIDDDDGDTGGKFVRLSVIDVDAREAMEAKRTRRAEAAAATSTTTEEKDAHANMDEQEEKARWCESGWMDLRQQPFDLYDELRIVKRDNGDYAGGTARARSAYHRESAKWHPTHVLTPNDDGPAAMNGFCDACSCVLQYQRWFHAHETSERGRDFCVGCVETSRRVIPGREWDRKYNTPPLVLEGEYVVVNQIMDLEPADVRARYESEPGSGVTKASAACAKFQRIAVAFSVFKDVEKFRIYRDHGYEGLVKSEAHAENDVFDLEPFAVYESFFAGEDPEDREYLLLNGAEPESESDDDVAVADDDAAGAHANGSISESDDDDDDDDPDDVVEELLARGKAELASAPKKPRVDVEDFPTPSIAVRIAASTDADVVLPKPLASCAHHDDVVNDDVWSAVAARFHPPHANDAA